VALTVALSLVVSFFPFVFFVPVLVVVTLQKWRLSLVCGLLFGVISFVYSFVRVTLVSVYFQANPLLPIVPRVLAVAFAHLSYQGVYAITQKRLPKTARALSAVVCAVVGSLTNTVFVMLGLVLFAKGFAYYGALGDAIVVFVGGSALIEVIVNIVLVSPISYALYQNPRVGIVLGQRAKALGTQDIEPATTAQPIQQETIEKEPAN